MPRKSGGRAKRADGGGFGMSGIQSGAPRTVGEGMFAANPQRMAAGVPYGARPDMRSQLSLPPQAMGRAMPSLPPQAQATLPPQAMGGMTPSLPPQAQATLPPQAMGGMTPTLPSQAMGGGMPNLPSQAQAMLPSQAMAGARPLRKAGGRTYRSYKDMDAGAGSGFGRLEKTEIQKRK